VKTRKEWMGLVAVVMRQMWPLAVTGSFPERAALTKYKQELKTTKQKARILASEDLW